MTVMRKRTPSERPTLACCHSLNRQLFFVATRMTLLEAPCIPAHRADIAAGVPAPLFVSAPRVGHRARRISGAPSGNLIRDRHAAGLLEYPDQFQHRDPGAGPEVQHLHPRAVIKVLHGEAV